MVASRGSTEAGNAPVSSVDVAAAIGEAALTQILARTPDGITIVDVDRRCVYANPVACRMLGRTIDELKGQDLSTTVLAGEPDSAALLAGRLSTPDGADREIVYFTFASPMADSPHMVSIFRDLTEPRAAVRSAVALAQTVAQLAGISPTNEVLAGVARHAVEGTRALSAGISVLGGEHELGVGGNHGPRGPSYSGAGPAWSESDDARGEDVIAAMTAGTITAGSVPGKAVVLSDARTAWEASPIMAGFARSMRGQDWDGAICVPLAWENRVIGVLGVYLPAGLAGPSEGELAFCTTLADQAAIAVSNARLSAQAGRAAALEERSRLARDLHDSVSQALFSMTMHARAAELSLIRDGVDTEAPLSRSIGQLAVLARGILAEMRALIFELRPEALAEEGLVGALTTQVAALSAREQISITLDGPQQSLDLDVDVEEHVYRIVSEALHNVVKHARADTATVTITTSPSNLRVTIDDDGVGFDPGTNRDGHLGLSTMADRAAVIGADLTVGSRRDSEVGSGRRRGTQLTLTVPVDARAPRAG